MNKTTAHYHLPGLFEFYELYRLFLNLYREHREYFYDWCDIGSIYGANSDCCWGGGRACIARDNTDKFLELLEEYHISARLTFSNSLLEQKDLDDEKCNYYCSRLSENTGLNGVIVYSEILTEYLRKKYPNLYLVSSTTKVLDNFVAFTEELKREEFSYVVADFRLNKEFKKLSALDQKLKDKVGFLCNECCTVSCTQRKECYEAVSRKNLGQDVEHICPYTTERGYRFSEAMAGPSFIGTEDIKNVYLPMGFSNFKIEGRGLGSAEILEFLLYYMTKPECQLKVREEIYLDSMLDLF